MAVIWMLRLGVSFHKCLPQGAIGCTLVGLLCACMASAHQCCVVLSWYRVGWGMHEEGKARFVLCDLTACMTLVILARNHVAFPVVFSPVLVFAIHGWAIPFAGCRLVADIYLHLLNLLVLVLLLVESQMSTLQSISWLNFIACVMLASVLPGIANLLYEARCRAAFAQSRAELHQLSRFWSDAAWLSYFVF